jgi:hypothetical protein
MRGLVKAKLRKIRRGHNKATKSEAKEKHSGALNCGGNAKRTEQIKGVAWHGCVSRRQCEDELNRVLRRRGMAWRPEQRKSKAERRIAAQRHSIAWQRLSDAKHGEAKAKHRGARRGLSKVI